METTVVQRFNCYLKSKRMSITAFCRESGLKQTTVNYQLNGTASLSVDTLSALIRTFPTLSAEWLLRGTEPIELSESTPDTELQAVCLDQAKEIYRLKQRIAELEGEKKERA